MTRLKKISIEHYKWFFEEQSVEFWIPDWINIWSWLTVITWPNNTWKTSLIEALLIWENNKKFFDEDCHQNCEPIIKFLLDNWNEIIHTRHNWWAQINIEWNNPLKIAPIFSRRHRNIESWASYTRNEQYFNQSKGKQNIRENSTQDLIPLLKKIDTSETREYFDILLKQILPNISWWSIWSTHHWDYIKYSTNNISHNSSSLGDWVLSVFVICANLVSCEDMDLIIIDEPELSLHPQAQKRLANVLAEISKQKQIIICTHSPYFINWKNLINWAKFVRLNKINDSKCTTHSLWNCRNYIITEWAIHDRHKPYTLEDIAAKEIMFSERILFVEGQEDVWLINKYCDWNFVFNFDIFWFWAWGWWRFRAFLRMCKDLGIEKVWVLYDWDVSEDEVNNIRSEFSEEWYEIKQLSTNDIRDKEPIYNQDGSKRCPEKKWIFDAWWNIKPSKKDEFDGIINSFIEYFS